MQRMPRSGERSGDKGFGRCEGGRGVAGPKLAGDFSAVLPLSLLFSSAVLLTFATPKPFPSPSISQGTPLPDRWRLTDALLPRRAWCSIPLLQPLAPFHNNPANPRKWSPSLSSSPSPPSWQPLRGPSPTACPRTCSGAKLLSLRRPTRPTLASALFPRSRVLLGEFCVSDGLEKRGTERLCFAASTVARSFHSSRSTRLASPKAPLRTSASTRPGTFFTTADLDSAQASSPQRSAT